MARKEAKSLPECFYKQNNLPVITPANAQAFLPLMTTRLDWKEVNVTLWSWYSGTGRLASTMVTNNQIVLFPVDLRYGWDLNDPDTFRMLMQIDEQVKPQCVTMEPRCKYWSIAGRTRAPEKTRYERDKEKQMLQRLVDFTLYLNHYGRLVCIENPASSALWSESPLASLKQSSLEYVIFAQCAHSDKPDGQRHLKETILCTNFPMENNQEGLVL